MSKQTKFLIGVALVMGYLYIIYFTTWFSRKTIQIDAAPRALPSGSTDPVFPMAFRLDQAYKLTSVKVFALKEKQISRYDKPVWQLTSSTNSAPIRGFVYGQSIQGMESDSKVPLQKLKPNVRYRMLLEARRGTGERDFLMNPRAVPTSE